MDNVETAAPPARTYSRLGKSLIGVGISAAFIWFVLRGVNLDEVRARFVDINLAAVPAVLLLLVGVFLLKALRWKCLIAPLRRVSLMRCFKVIVIAFMVNNTVPLRGGDLLRAHLLGRYENISRAMILTTVALDRIFDLLALLSVSGLALLLIPLPGWMFKAMTALGCVLIVAVAGVLIFKNSRHRVEAWILRWGARLPEKLRGLLMGILEQLHAGLGSATGKTRMAMIYGIAIVEAGVWVVLTGMTLSMIGIKVPVGALLSTIVATDLGVMIPAAPANVGVFEFAVMTTLEFFQIAKSVALSGAMLLHAVHVIPIALLGLVFLLQYWLQPREAKR